RPAAVAEVALDLADDVRRRVRRQLDATPEVEAVDRLDQADGADLDEILELLAPVGVAPRERADERHVVLDQLLPRRAVALLVVAAEEVTVALLGHLPRLPGDLDPFRQPHVAASLALLDLGAVGDGVEQAAQTESLARVGLELASELRALERPHGDREG